MNIFVLIDITRLINLRPILLFGALRLSSSVVKYLNIRLKIFARACRISSPIYQLHIT